METKRAQDGGISRMAASATLSAIALVAVLGWHVERVMTHHDDTLTASAASATDQSDTSDDLSADTQFLNTPMSTSSSVYDVSALGPSVVAELTADYALMKQNGTYTPEAGSQIADALAPNVQAKVSYTTYTVDQIKADDDTSRARVAQYHKELEQALSPLLQNKDLELSVFGHYVETRDPQYLEKLTAISQSYKQAASVSAALTVPHTAVLYHIGLLNAMQEFSATLDALTVNVDDPITTTALLVSYNKAEADAYSALNAITAYFAQKNV